MSRSNYGPVNDPETGIGHTFVPENIALGDGALELKVSAYQNDNNVISSELVVDELFKYASVRVVQKSSTTPGICEGNFFYCEYNNPETDKSSVLMNSWLRSG